MFVKFHDVVSWLKEKKNIIIIIKLDHIVEKTDMQKEDLFFYFLKSMSIEYNFKITKGKKEEKD